MSNKQVYMHRLGSKFYHRYNCEFVTSWKEIYNKMSLPEIYDSNLYPCHTCKPPIIAKAYTEGQPEYKPIEEI